LITSDSTPAQKQAFFHQLLQQDFDIPGTARFVFGPHRRVATEPEQQEFIKLFEDYIVRSIVSDLRNIAVKLSG
jgi:ABC-type transporter MlaC component